MTETLIVGIIICIIVFNINVLGKFVIWEIGRYMALKKCIKIGNTVFTCSSFMYILPYCSMMFVLLMWKLLDIRTTFWHGIACMILGIVVGAVFGWFISGVAWIRDETLHYSRFLVGDVEVSFKELQEYAKEVKPFFYAGNMIVFAGKHTCFFNLSDLVGGYSFVNVLFQKLNWELPRLDPKFGYKENWKDPSAEQLYRYVQMRRKDEEEE